MTILGDLVRMSTEVTLDVVPTEITVGDHFRADEFQSVSDRAEFLASASIGDRPRGHQVENLMFDLDVSATSVDFSNSGGDVRRSVLCHLPIGRAFCRC